MRPARRAACRSAITGAFDACPACVDTALDAVVQSGLFVLASIVPAFDSRTPPVEEPSYRLQIRLLGDDGGDLAADDLEVRTSAPAVADAASPEGAGVPLYGRRRLSSMRLDDFQAVLDELALQPIEGAISGVVVGTLLGYSRPVGTFEIVIGPGR